MSPLLKVVSRLKYQADAKPIHIKASFRFSPAAASCFAGPALTQAATPQSAPLLVARKGRYLRKG